MVPARSSGGVACDKGTERKRERERHREREREREREMVHGDRDEQQWW